MYIIWLSKWVNVLVLLGVQVLPLHKGKYKYETGEDKEEFCGLDWNWRYQYDSHVLQNIYLLTYLPLFNYLI